MNIDSEQPPSLEDLSLTMQELLGFKQGLEEEKRVEVEKNYIRLRALLCLQDFTQFKWVNKSSFLKQAFTKFEKTEHILDLINEELINYEKEESEEKQQKILETIENKYLAPAFDHAQKRESLVDFYGKGRDTIDFRGVHYSFSLDKTSFNSVEWKYDNTYVPEPRRYGPNVKDPQDEKKQKYDAQNVLGLYISEVMDRWNELSGSNNADEEESSAKPTAKLKIMRTVKYEEPVAEIKKEETEQKEGDQKKKEGGEKEKVGS